MTLVIAPPLQPWPDYLRTLADAAFVGEPAALTSAELLRAAQAHVESVENGYDRKYILSDGKPAASITDPIVAGAGTSMPRTDLPGFGVDLAAAASAVNDLDRAAGLRVARLRIEALEAELDLARQTIALLSQRPSHQAYDALQQERDALRTQVPVVVAPAKPGIPSRALRFSV